jgi:hypothetical protein
MLKCGYVVADQPVVARRLRTRSCRGRWRRGNAKLIQSRHSLARGGVLEMPRRGIRGKWLNVQGVAEILPISFRGCVGLAICATTIKDALLRLSQNVRGAAELVRISFTGCVGLAICATTIRDVRLGLSQMDKDHL